jgi:hypothetical protein
VLRGIFGTKWDEVTRKWRKLHIEELNVPLPNYFLGDKIENNVIGRACGTYGGEEKRLQGFGGET